MNAGFWICTVLAIVNFIGMIINIRKLSGVWMLNFVATIICAGCAAGIFHDNKVAEQRELARDIPERIENIRELRIDTTYVVTSHRTDTVYAVSYFLYEDK